MPKNFNADKTTELLKLLQPDASLDGEEIEEAQRDQAMLLIDQGADPDTTDSGGRTLLYKLVGNSNSDPFMIKLVEKYQADVNKGEGGEWGSPLQKWLSCNMPVSQALLLLGLKANPNVCGDNGNTVLQGIVLASQQPQKEDANIQLLIKKYNIPINANNKKKRTNALWSAIEKPPYPGKVEFLQWLVDLGAELLPHDDWYSSPLFAAAKVNDVAVGKWLMKQKNFHIDHKNKSRKTALFEACANGHLEFAQCLVEEKASITHIDHLGQTVLDNAANHLHLEIVKWLLNLAKQDLSAQTIINLNHKDTEGHTPIVHAIRNRGSSDKVPFLQELVQLGAELLPDNKQKTPLFYAARGGDVAVGKWLKGQKGIDIEAKSTEERTALFEACLTGNLQFAKWLVEEEHACVTGVDCLGQTLLHIAVKRNDIAMVEWLLSLNKIDVTVQDKDGKTAMEMKPDFFTLNPKITQLLQTAKAAQIQREEALVKEEVEDLLNEMAKKKVVGDIVKTKKAQEEFFMGALKGFKNLKTEAHLTYLVSYMGQVQDMAKGQDSYFTDIRFERWSLFGGGNTHTWQRMFSAAKEALMMKLGAPARDSDEAKKLVEEAKKIQLGEKKFGEIQGLLDKHSGRWYAAWGWTSSSSFFRQRFKAVKEEGVVLGNGLSAKV